MNIPTYKTFEEKAEHFKQIQIDSYKDFKDVYDKHSTSLGVYRGITSSSYKIFSSKQREFFNKGSNFDYISLIEQNDIIQEYFRLANIPKTELSYLSLLQHYGKPTPYLDFTKNFSKGLFFALDGVELKKDAQDINNYVTIFFISTEDFQLLNASEQFEGGAKANSVFDEFFKNYEDYSKDKVLRETESLVKIWLWDVFGIQGTSKIKDFIEISNNHRIIMQEGVFIHNEYKENKLLPLEESLKTYLKEESLRNYYSTWDDMDINRPDVHEKIREHKDYIDDVKRKQARLEENIIVSYEINKELVPEIQSKIKTPSKELMYMDLKEILEK